MKTLGISKEEAEDVMRCDAEIDRGAKLFEQTQEQKVVARKMAQTRSVNAYGKAVLRERKEDGAKREIMSVLADALATAFPLGDMEITNPEREMVFKIAGRRYKVVLSAPRK